MTKGFTYPKVLFYQTNTFHFHFRISKYSSKVRLVKNDRNSADLGMKDLDEMITDFL